MVPEPPRQSADDFENIILHWSFPRLEMIEPLRKGLGLKKTGVWMGWVKEIVPLDHNLAGLDDLFSQVLVAVVIVRPVRVPIFLKLNEGKEAGLLC